MRGLVLSVALLVAAAPVAGDEIGRFDSSEIAESSGLVRSRKYERVFWTHNDSGDRARIFAVTAEGRLLSEYTVEGARNVDWESIASDNNGSLFLGDFGNNENRRTDLAIYQIEEPDPFGEGGVIPVTRQIRFRYREQSAFPDPSNRNFDGEALFFAGDRLYLLTKHRSDHRTVLYRLPELTDHRQFEPEIVGEFDTGDTSVTGADATPDGRYLAVLTYLRVYIFERPADSDNYLSNLVKAIALDSSETKQCEGLGWDGDSIYFTNEQSVIHRIVNPLTKAVTMYPATGR